MVTWELHQARQAYFRKLNPKKPKEIWRAVKYLRKQKSTIPTFTDNDGTAHTISEKAKMLNSFFAKCFIDSQSAPLEDNQDTPQLEEIPEDRYCTEEEVCKLLGHLDTSKSNGPEYISARMLKQTAPLIALSITRLFNLSIRKGKIPNAWKESHVAPIPSKVLEKHICSLILGHLEEFHHLSNSQGGFRAERSTVRVLFSLG
jgi:hypothetical protein